MARKHTKDELRRLRRAGWSIMFAGPAAFAAVWVLFWVTYARQMTIFEEVVLYGVLPVSAVVLFVVGVSLVCKVSRQLREGDFEVTDDA